MRAGIIAALTMLLQIKSVYAEQAKSTDDIYNLTEIVAVQNRAYEFNQALGLGAGFYPADAFNQEFGFGGYYLHALNDHISWEVLRYHYLLNTPTAAKNDVLRQRLTLVAGNGGVLDYPVHIATTGVVFTPLYNKGLLFNRDLIYSEFSLYLGGGVGVFNATGNRYLLVPGFQGRFYLSQRYAVLGYFRDNIFVDNQQGVVNMFDFGVTLEIRLGSKGSSQ